MKSSVSQKIHYDSGPNMTPLVDVVMVILIFLMLCGSFGGLEHYLACNLPLEKFGGPAYRSMKQPAFADTRIEIRVDHNPANLDKWRVRFGDVATDDASTLTDALKAKLDTFKASGTGTDQLQVIISSSSIVKWKSLLAVYVAANEAGFTKIAFSS